MICCMPSQIGQNSKVTVTHIFLLEMKIHYHHKIPKKKRITTLTKNKNKKNMKLCMNSLNVYLSRTIHSKA